MTRKRKTHGHSRSGSLLFYEYRVWQNMKDRCHNSKYKHYKSYGGRGIKVCSRWRKAFENFIADIGPRPSAKHSIDRIENNKGYSKGNCRWATRKEQQRNTRANRLGTIDGKTLCMSAWIEKSHVCKSTFFNRLDRGWPLKDALFAPIGFIRETTKNISGVKGVLWNKNAKAWAAACYLNKKTKHIGYFKDKNDAIKARRDFIEKEIGIEKIWTCTH